MQTPPEILTAPNVLYLDTKQNEFIFIVVTGVFCTVVWFSCSVLALLPKVDLALPVCVFITDPTAMLSWHPLLSSQFDCNKIFSKVDLI